MDESDRAARKRAGGWLLATFVGCVALAAADRLLIGPLRADATTWSRAHLATPAVAFVLLALFLLRKRIRGGLKQLVRGKVRAYPG